MDLTLVAKPHLLLRIVELWSTVELPYKSFCMLALDIFVLCLQDALSNTEDELVVEVPVSQLSLFGSNREHEVLTTTFSTIAAAVSPRIAKVLVQFIILGA